MTDRADIQHSDKPLCADCAPWLSSTGKTCPTWTMCPKASVIATDWRDPPEAPRMTGIWVARLEPLMEYPKRWAMLHTYPGRYQAKANADRLRVGDVLVPAGRWEFTARQVEDGSELFGRYLGPDE